MNCPTCGAENAPGTPACTRCGAPLAQPPYTPAQGVYAPQQPVFGAPNPPRSGSSGLLVALLACGGCSILLVPILAAILFPVFAKARERAQAESCMRTAQQLAVAVQQYASSHGNRLPVATNWEDALQPNLGPLPPCPKATTGSGFVLNGSLAGRSTEIISDPANTVLLFEGGAGRNLAGGPGMAEARHSDRVTVAFADGSVRTYPASDLNRLKW